MDFNALYDAWASRLLGYMMTITRDRHLAEDALQNLFVKLATSPPECDDLPAYLFRAARNEALRVVRRRRDTPLISLDVIAPRAESGVDVAALTAALEQLPADQSEVVMLHALEELTFGQVGEVLGIPQDTAASRYRYAIEKLKALL